MKSVRFAYIIFSLLCLAVILNSIAVGKIIDGINREISESQINETVESEYTAIYEKYKTRKLYISLSVDHDDLSNIEDAFTEIIGAAKANDETALLTAKSRLTYYLGHVKRLSGINIDSIF